MALSPPTAQEPPGFAYAAGDVIGGKYELEELLGEGGMGAVFRARNTAIDMPVAIKVIRADLNRELLSGRLLQEARAAAKLTHPAIVRVFDVDQTASGDPFIVMELLSGESLASVMVREGRLTSARAVQLLLPIADALSAAHNKGFVHRDVKPDNVFVVVSDDQLQPKLVDFGIVKLEQHDKDSKLTQVGTVLGSPDYMSPEQARGLDDIDLRSDVWSFSVMLYEAIAGETPFSSPNYNALLRSIVEDEPHSLLSLRAADAALSAIVARGLNKDPDLRFQSMSQLGRALAEWLTSQGFAEDACGVSLEAKWLSRSSAPQARTAGRSSSPGGPDSWSEAPSGLRAADSRSDFGTAPTVHHGKEAGTPISLAPLTATIPPRARSLYLGGAGAALATAIAVAWWGASSDANSVRVGTAASTGEAALEPSSRNPALSPTPRAIAPAAAASVQPPATTASAPTGANKHKPVRPSPPLRKPALDSKAPPDAPPTPKPASDLLSPY